MAFFPPDIFTLVLHFCYICFAYLIVYLSALFYSLCLTHCFSLISWTLFPANSSWYLYLFMCNSSLVRSRDQSLTLISVLFSFVFISHLTNFCSLLCSCMNVCLYSVSHFAFEKEPARFDISKANNHYFAKRQIQFTPCNVI